MIFNFITNLNKRLKSRLYSHNTFYFISPQKLLIFYKNQQNYTLYASLLAKTNINYFAVTLTLINVN